MPVDYSCDKCKTPIPNSIDTVRVSGPRRYYIFCESCWEQIENKFLREKEAVNVNQE